MQGLLIANRGEIAIRIARTAAAMGLRAVAVAPDDDMDSLHVRMAGDVARLPGRGAAAYLDIAATIAAAKDSGCDAIHPGYGFLSENADLAQACIDAGLTFVGPRPEHLELFGDKSRARALAIAENVPVVEGTPGGASLDRIEAFMAGLPAGSAIMVKAVSGGGGRGMRVVRDRADLPEAFARCASEARAAFGRDALYAERLIERPRHVEVQILGDGTGAAIHLWERDCTLQRRHQKLIEIAPARSIPMPLRQAMHQAALRLAGGIGYRGLATVEFLVEPATGSFTFMEVNPRLQVEHTITEQITGLDLVELQLMLAQGARLADLGLVQPDREPALSAIQLRLNAEAIADDGRILPATGVITRLDLPGGPGVRVDSGVAPGSSPNPAYDSLLAKLVVTAPPARLIQQGARALAELRLGGPASNAPLLAALLASQAMADDAIDTGLVERDIRTLMASDAARSTAVRMAEATAVSSPGVSTPADEVLPAGTGAIRASMTGLLATLAVAPGDLVGPGQQVAILEAMKAEIPLLAETGGRVGELRAAPGDLVSAGQILAVLEPDAAAADHLVVTEAPPDPDHVRPDLAELLARRHAISDAGRPDAVAKRHARGHRTARENIADLCDPGSFHEYGGLMLAAQRGRRNQAELEAVSPADGTVTGTATLNADLFPGADTRVGVLHYDYTVFAGTQGFAAHRKMDRMFQLAVENRLPFVLFAEGGGGRPGDTDYLGPSGLDLKTFRDFARLTMCAPVAGIVSGRCFAGNAALLGTCHVVIATLDATIGMAGPAMIEAGGLGQFTPEEVGPAAVQAANGVIDILVEDEAEAVAAARRWMGYFQGSLPDWSCADQRLLRHALPENRLRAYDMRKVIDLLCDQGSVMELRQGFGAGIITALVRIEGRPMGLVASNPLHLGGAIDADSADKLARFIQLCDGFGLPLVSLCDTPGFMVGPASEEQATVRHFARLFLAGARMTTPFVSILLRKAYGLGAQAMAGGAFLTGQATLAWPSGEMGPMGLEGAVRLAYRKEAEAIADPDARSAYVTARIDELYARGKAMNVASYMEIDDVIDPAETRARILAAIAIAPPGQGTGADGTTGKGHVDAW